MANVSTLNNRIDVSVLLVLLARIVTKKSTNVQKILALMVRHALIRSAAINACVLKVTAVRNAMKHTRHVRLATHVNVVHVLKREAEHSASAQLVLKENSASSILTSAQTILVLTMQFVLVALILSNVSAERDTQENVVKSTTTTV